MTVDQPKTARTITRLLRKQRMTKLDLATRLKINPSQVVRWSTPGGRLIPAERVIPALKALGGGRPYSLRPDVYPDRGWVV